MATNREWFEQNRGRQNPTFAQTGKRLLGEMASAVAPQFINDYVESQRRMVPIAQIRQERVVKQPQPPVTGTVPPVVGSPAGKIARPMAEEPVAVPTNPAINQVVPTIYPQSQITQPNIPQQDQSVAGLPNSIIPNGLIRTPTGVRGNTSASTGDGYGFIQSEQNPARRIDITPQTEVLPEPTAQQKLDYLRGMYAEQKYLADNVPGSERPGTFAEYVNARDPQFAQASGIETEADRRARLGVTARALADENVAKIKAGADVLRAQQRPQMTPSQQYDLNAKKQEAIGTGLGSIVRTTPGIFGGSSTPLSPREINAAQGFFSQIEQQLGTGAIDPASFVDLISDAVDRNPGAAIEDVLQSILPAIKGGGRFLELDK